MLASVLNILFPRHSLQGDSGEHITAEERQRIEERLRPMFLGKELLMRQGMTHLDALVASAEYDGNHMLRQAILRMKYGRVRTLGHDIGHWMATRCENLIIPPDQHATKPILCPVPLHWSREYWRGFNQADILAQEIGHERGWGVRNLLRRDRPTGHQASRRREERLSALHNAFQIAPEYAGRPLPMWVVLIDDICTTGATLRECAITLKRAGVCKVTACVAAFG